MATQSQSLSHKASKLAWKTEQTLTLLVAVSFGTAVGLLIGLFRAVRSLAPHFKSRDGLKRLYYGDPSLAHKFQRGYLQNSYTSATLKPHGASPTLSSTEVGKTAVPSLVNGHAKGHTDQTSGDSRPILNGSTPATNGLQRADEPGSGASYADDATPKMGATTPESEEAGDSETETEGEGETGSEYTATSSTPGTPRSTIVAPPGDGTQKVKKRKKAGKKIKKAFSKIADVFTPSSTSTSPKA